MKSLSPRLLFQEKLEGMGRVGGCSEGVVFFRKHVEALMSNCHLTDLTPLPEPGLAMTWGIQLGSAAALKANSSALELYSLGAHTMMMLWVALAFWMREEYAAKWGRSQYLLGCTKFTAMAKSL